MAFVVIESLTRLQASCGDAVRLLVNGERLKSLSRLEVLGLIDKT